MNGTRVVSQARLLLTGVILSGTIAAGVKNGPPQDGSGSSRMHRQPSPPVQHYPKRPGQDASASPAVVRTMDAAVPPVVPTPDAGSASVVATPSASVLDLYQRLTVSIATTQEYENPFDPDDIAIDLIIHTPQGRAINLPCFYLSGDPGSSQWEARFTPRVHGSYTYRVHTTRNGIPASTSSAHVFDVLQSGGDGFLHVSADCRHTLRHDSGKPFRGVGINFAWEGGGYTYADMFPHMHRNGMNFVRTWMNPWNAPLEWSRSGPVHYDTAAARTWDRVFIAAGEQGLYVMLTLDYHGVFVTRPDHWGGNNYWAENPYNIVCGGMCDTPADFFSDLSARDAYRKRLRYIIARWGYSTQLAALEFFNEIDHAINNEGVPVATVVDWHDDMATWLKSIDPYEHIVTTSVSHEYYPDLWRLPSIDMTQSHHYRSDVDVPGVISAWNTAYDKPFVMGEFGFDWREPVRENPDRHGFTRDLQVGLWRGLFSATPILPMTWWWDYHDQWGDFPLIGAVGTFNRRFLDEATTGISPLEVYSSPELELHGLQAGRVMAVWARNSAPYEWGTGEVYVGQVAEGEWRVCTFDTRQGTFSAPQTLQASDGTLSLPRPLLQSDQSVAWLLVDEQGGTGTRAGQPVADLPLIRGFDGRGVLVLKRQGNVVLLDIAVPGIWSVALYSLDGRKIGDVAQRSLERGVQRLALGSGPVPAGMYVLQMREAASRHPALTCRVMVR